MGVLEKTVRPWERGVGLQKGGESNQMWAPCQMSCGSTVALLCNESYCTTFRKTSITIDYAKLLVFWVRCLSLLAKWKVFFILPDCSLFLRSLWNGLFSCIVQSLNSQFRDSKGRTVAYYLGYSLCNIKQEVFKSVTHILVSVRRGGHTGKSLLLTCFCERTWWVVEIIFL